MPLPARSPIQNDREGSSSLFFGSCGLYAEKSSRHHSDARTLARSLRWFNHRLVPPAEMPSALRPWLLAEGSLTRHLLRASNGNFRVQRVAQHWSRPTLTEAKLLDIEPNRWALIREVILWGCDAPWVYARSVIPAHSLHGDLRRLRQLRNTSLGALLFKYPHLQRTPFELARVDSTLLPVSLQTDTALWGRRSRFSVNGRSLIVGEIFLDALVRSPALTQYPPQ
jgi:chorismate lyase